MSDVELLALRNALILSGAIVVIAVALARWIERTQPMVHFGWGIGLGLWRNPLGHTVVWTLALGPVTVHFIRAP